MSQYTNKCNTYKSAGIEEFRDRERLNKSWHWYSASRYVALNQIICVYVLRAIPSLFDCNIRCISNKKLLARLTDAYFYIKWDRSVFRAITLFNRTNSCKVLYVHSFDLFTLASCILHLDLNCHSWWLFIILVSIFIFCKMYL
jgi:hypothetical protein